MYDDDDVVESAVSSEELPDGDCLRLCREGLAVIREEYQFNYNFKEMKEPESEKYYTVRLENEDSESVDVVHVLAFKCPIRPDVFIHVRELYDEESLVWVITQDRIAMYTKLPVESIHASTYQKPDFGPSQRSLSFICHDFVFISCQFVPPYVLLSYWKKEKGGKKSK